MNRQLTIGLCVLAFAFLFISFAMALLQHQPKAPAEYEAFGTYSLEEVAQ
jgi:hypothetical protein